MRMRGQEGWRIADPLTAPASDTGMTGQVEVLIKSRKPWAPGHQSEIKGRSGRSLETVASGRHNGNVTDEKEKKK